MAIILTNVNVIPRGCTIVNSEWNEEGWYENSVSQCPLYSVCKQRDTINANKRPKKCPLKSIDSLIEDIQTMDFDFGDLYDHTDTIAKMVVDKIKDYCLESEDKE